MQFIQSCLRVPKGLKHGHHSKIAAKVKKSWEIIPSELNENFDVEQGGKTAYHGQCSLTAQKL